MRHMPQADRGVSCGGTDHRAGAASGFARPVPGRGVFVNGAVRIGGIRRAGWDCSSTMGQGEADPGADQQPASQPVAQPGAHAKHAAGASGGERPCAVEAAGDDPPWIAALSLRWVDYAPIAEALGELGMVTEQVEGFTVPQRRFASPAERDAALAGLHRAHHRP